MNIPPSAMQPCENDDFVTDLDPNNVIVVTARGQPFERGILLDNWRYGGHLVYVRVGMDPEYRWTENRAELARRLKANSTPTTESGPATGETKRLMRR